MNRARPPAEARQSPSDRIPTDAQWRKLVRRARLMMFPRDRSHPKCRMYRVSEEAMRDGMGRTRSGRSVGADVCTGRLRRERVARAGKITRDEGRR